MILTNAWLGTEWGDQFRRNLLRWYHLKIVVTSGAGRWFRNSEVVTNLLILEKRAASADLESIQNEETRFVVLKRRLEEYTDADASRVCAAQIAKGESHEDSIFVRRVSQADQADFQVLGLAGSAQFVECDWVKDLPLVPVSRLCEIRRGERRGWDRMFYPSDSHNIESEYLRPVVKSSSDIQGYASANTSGAFCCGRAREELQRLNHAGAEAWIARFEHAQNNSGKPLPDVLRKAGHHWYEMRDDQLGELVLPMNIDVRFFATRLDPPAFVNQRLIALNRLDSSFDIRLLHALLNSTITYFMIEGMGFGRGLGVLDLNKDRVEEKLHLLDPSGLSPDDRRSIIEAFEPIRSREIRDIADELDSADRQAFDDAVLEAFGVKVSRAEVYQALLTLVGIRLTAKDEPDEDA